jgi:hypothetical protein
VELPNKINTDQDNLAAIKTNCVLSGSTQKEAISGQEEQKYDKNRSQESVYQDQLATCKGNENAIE